MKNKYKKILIILIPIIILIISFKISHKDNIILDNNLHESDHFVLEDNNINFIPKDSINNISEENTKTIVPKQDDIYLYVLDREYVTYLNNNDTVYSVMNRLMQEDDFSFEGYNQSPLGFFVKKINNQNQSNGKYWIYYVNNVEAQVGISSYILKKGDIISWKLE